MNASMLPGPGETKNLTLSAGGGAVEAVLSAPRTPRAHPGFALVCHPHPLMGGAMSNKVTYMLASSALQAGLYALRFNFRGVGASEGQHDEGRGEVDDAVSLYRWLQTQLPQAQGVIAGFSFGGYIALSAAARLNPAALVTVAPPFRYFVDRPTPQPECPWLLIHGRDDEVVAYEDTERKLAELAKPPRLVSVDGSGHFFHGRLDLVRDNVLPFLDEWLA